MPGENASERSALSGSFPELHLVWMPNQRRTVLRQAALWLNACMHVFKRTYTMHVTMLALPEMLGLSASAPHTHSRPVMAVRASSEGANTRRAVLGGLLAGVVAISAPQAQV